MLLLISTDIPQSQKKIVTIIIRRNSQVRMSCILQRKVRFQTIVTGEATYKYIFLRGEQIRLVTKEQIAVSNQDPPFQNTNISL